MEEPKVISQLKLGYQTSRLVALCGNAVGAASIAQLLCRTFADRPRAIGEESAWTEVVS
jgi:hypothetical protein